MSNIRNTNGMIGYVRKRHDELVTRVDGVLCELEIKGQNFDFQKVADLADVSIAWLYKSQFKKRIIATRNKDLNPSNNLAIDSLQDRIAELERINRILVAENERLRSLTKKTAD